MSPEEVKRVEHEEAQLRVSYGEIMKTPAGQHLLERLTAWEKKDYDAAAAEMSDLAKKSMNLQSSVTYAKVKAHLLEMRKPSIK
jgi:hypothetical protein